MRVAQGRGTRGSLKWIQALVNDNSQLLTDAIRAAARRSSEWDATWVAPLERDDWAEYRDRDFLAVLGLERLAEQLEAFWPVGGPQWDALAQGTGGGAVLVEAKSHAGELSSSCQAESAASIAKISSSLDAAKRVFGAEATADWMNGFYQYANRLAHLDFLLRHGVDATLVFLYFVNDADMEGPAHRSQWTPALEAAYRHLGLRTAPGHVVNVFVDVAAAPPRVAD